MHNIEARFRHTLSHFELDVAFTAPSRGITALFGPSGCGKTTVLRCIAGLQRLKEGHLKVDGRMWQDGTVFMPPHRRPIGYVFQEASLFPHLSVQANLAYGFKRSHVGTKKPDFNEIIHLFGLKPLLDRSPKGLSGGERQRVAIGRALMSGPEVLLMDEPLAALDQCSKNEILPYLVKLHDYLEIPVLYVSHDIAEIERLADHLVLMESGRVQAFGNLVDMLSDPNLPLARMSDAAVVIEGNVVDYDHRYDLSTLSVPGGILIVPGQLGEIDTPRRLRIIASDVALCRTRAPEGSSILNGPAARIVTAEALGTTQMNVFLRLGQDGRGGKLLARITRKSWDTLKLCPGELVYALIKSVALVDKK